MPNTLCYNCSQPCKRILIKTKTPEKRLVRYRGFIYKVWTCPLSFLWHGRLIYFTIAPFNSLLLQVHTRCSILLEKCCLAVIFQVIFPRHNFIISTRAQGSHTPILLLPHDNTVSLTRKPSGGPKLKLALIVQGLDLLLFTILFSF